MNYGQQICEDLVAFLNGLTFSQPFTATAPQDPHTELNLDATGEKYKGVQVFVIPVSQAEERGDRGGHVAVRHGVNVFISRFLTDTATDTVTRKNMSDLVAEIRASVRFTCFQDWVWEATDTAVPYDPDQLRVQFRFLAVLNLTYWNAE